MKSVNEKLWYGKPYYSLDAYCKDMLGGKCYKIALNAGLGCPNRDGTIGTGGCIFCSMGGSGEFAVDISGKSMEEQLKEGISRFGNKVTGERFIAYFQAYSNTYGSTDYLEKIYTQALAHPDICGISIATRPDCIPDEILELLMRLKKQFPQKFIWVELGLQTIREETARYIRRGYPLPCFEETYRKLKQAQIPVIVHVILGLPGESREDMYQTIAFLNRIIPFGVKLQLLHVLAGTDLAKDYQAGKFAVLSEEEYLEILMHGIALLRPEIVIHRVTGDGPKELTLAPLWSLNKRRVLNRLHQEMNRRGVYQGSLFGANLAGEPAYDEK